MSTVRPFCPVGHLFSKSRPALLISSLNSSCCICLSGAQHFGAVCVLTISTEFLCHRCGSVRDLNVLLWGWGLEAGWDSRDPCRICSLPLWLRGDRLQLSEGMLPCWILSSPLLRWLLWPELRGDFGAVLRSCLSPEHQLLLCYSQQHARVVKMPMSQLFRANSV